jgi:hypothetical protein
MTPSRISGEPLMESSAAGWLSVSQKIWFMTVAALAPGVAKFGSTESWFK